MALNEGSAKEMTIDGPMEEMEYGQPLDIGSNDGELDLEQTESLSDWYDHSLFSRESDQLFEHKPIESMEQ